MLILFSGGLDSTTLAYRALAENKPLKLLLSIDYGQRHKKELHFAEKTAKVLGISHLVIDLKSVTHALTNCALTDKTAVPDGHYTEESMRITVVPNRNAMMLTIAFGIASAQGYTEVGTAVHGGDHFIYPDCRPTFISAFQTMQNHALEGMNTPHLWTPYLMQDKTAIARDAGKFNVPIENTWSCYKGGEIHCGRCGTCVERREALELAGVTDTTPYLDRDYWQEAVARVARQKTPSPQI